MHVCDTSSSLLGRIACMECTSVRRWIRAPSSKCMVPWAHPSLRPKEHVDHMHRFCIAVDSPCTLLWGVTCPPKLPLPLGGYGPTHNTCHNLPKFQITRLQQIQNSLVRAVVKASKSSHITPILLSLHWLKINERIEYKLLSLTYKVLTTTQPSYLHNLITVQPPRSTRSSSLVTLARPSTTSSLRIMFRSFLPVCFSSSLESTPGPPPSTPH